MITAAISAGAQGPRCRSAPRRRPLRSLSAAASRTIGRAAAAATPRPIGNAPVTANPTPYSAALVCLSGYARRYGVAAPRIAVGRIADYTGKDESRRLGPQAHRRAPR